MCALKKSISTSHATVGQSTVLALITHMINKGCTWEDIKRSTGYEEQQTLDPEARIPIHQYQQIWECAIDWTNNPALGLKLEAKQECSDMGIVGHVVTNCENLQAGLEHYIRLYGVVNDTVSLCYDSDEQLGYLNFIHSASEHYCIPDVERSFVLALYRTQAWFGKALHMNAVYFQHKEPEYSALYKQIFSCPVYFSQSICRIAFDKAYFELQPKRTNQFLKTAALQYANAQLKRFDYNSIAERVKTLLYKDIELREPSFSRIAERLHMSKQTLYRKLKLEGAFFQKLVEKVRFEKSKQLLAQSSMSTSEIALTLGFSELSAFSRAFKRWSGMSPKMFRESMPAYSF